MLVDDSAVVRGAVGRMVDAAADMRIVTTATTGRQALAALAHTPVDVILLDVEMPDMDGLTALPLLLQQQPGVQVIMQSSLTLAGASVTMQALALGATDFITKPTARGMSGLQEIEREIVAKIRAVGRRSSTVGTVRPPSPPVVARPRAILGARDSAALQVIAIASSTGGPNALAEVLKGLPADVTLPILITQHMPPVFTGLLAQRLTRDCGRDCVEAVEEMPVRAGRVYIAPGDRHMVVATHEGVPFLRLTADPPENHCRPAADVMLRSVAAVYGNTALVVVLTGMGEDGRRGCEVIHARGGRVIAQDEASSVVWGMPGAVVAAGLADHVLPLGQIAGKVANLCLVPA
ncbi:MAG: chemotaxis response regulator protein-glutamate methylesterase [Gemmatimonadetes bacterium]|nr:chemotaxis response regulator protein-glutamate methylesterase [Gemmatimonadota bacterium]